MSKLNKENWHRDKPEQNTGSFLRGRYSRRTFLKQTVAIGAAGLIGPVVLTACGNEQAAERSEAETRPIDRTAPGATVSGRCEGNADLPAADMAARQAVNYVDESPQSDKFCANCRFFKPPVASAVCGGCKIVKGPITPEGYCNTWAA